MNCKLIIVTTKGWKEVKWEIKENFKMELDVFFEKRVFEDKRKDAEIDDWRRFVEEPEWLKAAQSLAQRSDEIEAHLRKKAFIKEDERPVLGEEALETSAAKEEKTASLRFAAGSTLPPTMAAPKRLDQVNRPACLAQGRTPSTKKGSGATGHRKP